MKLLTDEEYKRFKLLVREMEVLKKASDSPWDDNFTNIKWPKEEDNDNDN